jgi:hypothetical protein
MQDDAGGWLWLIIDVVMVAIFAAALIYGTIMWRSRRRTPATERVRDEATRRAFSEEQNR